MLRSHKSEPIRNSLRGRDREMSLSQLKVGHPRLLHLSPSYSCEPHYLPGMLYLTLPKLHKKGGWRRNTGKVVDSKPTFGPLDDTEKLSCFRDNSLHPIQDSIRLGLRYCRAPSVGGAAHMTEYRWCYT